MKMVKKMIGCGVRIFEPSGNELSESEVLELYEHLSSYMIKLTAICSMYPIYRKTFIEFLIIHRTDEELHNLAYEKFKNIGVCTDSRFNNVIGELKNGFSLCRSFDEHCQVMYESLKKDMIKPYYVILKGEDEYNEVVSPMELFNLIKDYSKNEGDK